MSLDTEEGLNTLEAENMESNTEDQCLEISPSDCLEAKSVCQTDCDIEEESPAPSKESGDWKLHENEVDSDPSSYSRQLPHQSNLASDQSLSPISSKQVEDSKAIFMNPKSSVKKLLGQRIKAKEMLCSGSFVPTHIGNSNLNEVGDSKLNNTGTSNSKLHLKEHDISDIQPLPYQSNDKEASSSIISTSVQLQGENNSIIKADRNFEKTNEIETPCSNSSILVQTSEEPLIDLVQPIPKVVSLFDHSTNDITVSIHASAHHSKETDSDNKLTTQDESDEVSSQAFDNIGIVRIAGFDLQESDLENCKSNVVLNKDCNPLNSDNSGNIENSSYAPNNLNPEFTPIIEGSLSFQDKELSTVQLQEPNTFKIQAVSIEMNSQNCPVSSSKSSNSSQYSIHPNSSDVKSSQVIHVENTDQFELGNYGNIEKITSLPSDHFEEPGTDIKPSLNALNSQIGEVSSVDKLFTLAERSEVLNSQNNKNVPCLSPQWISISKSEAKLTQNANDGPGTSLSSADIQITDASCSRTFNNPCHKGDLDSDIKPIINEDGSINFDPLKSQTAEIFSKKSSMSSSNSYLGDYDSNDIKPILNTDGSIAFDPLSSAGVEAANNELTSELHAVVESDFKPILDSDGSILFDPMKPLSRKNSINDLNVEKHSTDDVKPILNLNGSFAMNTQSTDVLQSVESDVEKYPKLNDNTSEILQVPDTEKHSISSEIIPDNSSPSVFQISPECEKSNIPVTSDIEKCKPCTNSCNNLLTSSCKVGFDSNTDIEKPLVSNLENSSVNQDKPHPNSENVCESGSSNLKETVSQPTLTPSQKKRRRKKAKKESEKAQQLLAQNSQIVCVESNALVVTNSPPNKTYKIAVFPVGYPHSILPVERVKEFKDAFLEKIDNIKLVDKISPKFDGIKYETGGCLINCLDQATECWTAKTVKELRLKGLQLVTGKPEVLTHTMVVGFFRGPVVKPDQFIHRLKIQNLELKHSISKWKPFILKEMPSGFYAALEVLNSHMRFLKNRSSSVNYYLGSVKLVSPPPGVNPMEPDESWASWCPIENKPDISMVGTDAYCFSEQIINKNEDTDKFPMVREREKYEEKGRVKIGGKVRRSMEEMRIERREEMRIEGREEMRIERREEMRIERREEMRFERREEMRIERREEMKGKMENRKRRYDDRFEEVRSGKYSDEVRKERRIQEERRLVELRRERPESLDKDSATLFYKKVQRWKESGVNEDRKDINSSSKGCSIQKKGERKEDGCALIDSQYKWEDKNIAKQRAEVEVVQKFYKTSTEAKLASDSLHKNIHWWIQGSSDEENSGPDSPTSGQDQLNASHGVDHLMDKKSKERKRVLTNADDPCSSHENSLDHRTYSKKQKMCDLSTPLENYGAGKHLGSKSVDPGRSLVAPSAPVVEPVDDQTTADSIVRASAFFPADYSGTYVSTQVILTRLRRQNIAAAVEKWTIREVLRGKTGIYVRLYIPDTSLPALQAREFRLYYNLGRVRILLASDIK